MITYVGIFLNSSTDPEKFWLSAVKAAQVQAIQLCNAKEYEFALKLLKNVSQKLTLKLIDHFFPTDKKDEAKVLQDNLYSFTYRRMVCQHHIYFTDLNNAEKQLKALLQDELNFYGFKKAGTTDETHILEQIDTEFLNNKEILDSEEQKYSHRAHPYFRVLQTLMLLGDVYASKNKFDEAFKLYDFIQSGYLKMFGTNETVLNSYVHQ